MAPKKPNSIIPGGVDEYITLHSKNVQLRLKQIRTLIQSCAPDSIETVSYFQIPGYSMPGYDYNGMFAWFSYVEPYVRLHIRPPVIENSTSKLKGYKKTKAIVSFLAETELPEQLIMDLVKASIHAMTGKNPTQSVARKIKGQGVN